ncbi:MAG TPA: metal-sensitive transcriptional regulator [Chloroflexia bacterium]|nr:metal-sensitive transcriptional regulator [Chloroflexia bacterium]
MHGYHADKDKLQARLKRIEGQVRGLQRMIEDDKYCIDIITQISSVQAALQQVSVLLLEDHMRGCVTDAISEGGEAANDKINEMMQVLGRYARSPQYTE